MTRVARVVVPGYPHHVIQRGNRRADVFFTEDDCRFYLAQLRKYALAHGVDIWAYCLMSNHIHVVAVPATEEALARAFRDTHTVYAMRFNQEHELSGHVWQGRFLSSVLDDKHLWACVRYIERNPVRARMVGYAHEHPWSSARARCLGTADPLLATDFPPPGIINDWAQWLCDEDDDTTQTIRQATRTGRPCGSSRFLDRLEGMLGRTLRPRKRGPRKGD